jgi:hypothetical protein
MVDHQKRFRYSSEMIHNYIGLSIQEQADANSTSHQSGTVHRNIRITEENPEIGKILVGA